MTILSVNDDFDNYNIVKNKYKNNILKNININTKNKSFKNENIKNINIKINKNYEYGKGILYNDNYNKNNYCLYKDDDIIKIVEVNDIKTDNYNYITNINVTDLDNNTFNFKPILGKLYPLYSSPFLAFYTSKLGKITLDYINEYPPCGYYMGYGYMKDDIPFKSGYIYETNKWNKTKINNKLLRYSIGLKNLNEPLNHSYLSIKVYKHENNESTKEYNKKKKYWLNRCYKWLAKKEENGNFAYYKYKRNQFLRKVIAYYKTKKIEDIKINKNIKNEKNIKNKNKELNNNNTYIMNNNIHTNNNEYTYTTENMNNDILYDMYGNIIEETKEEKESRLYREDFEYKAQYDPFTMSMLHFMNRRLPNGQSNGWSKCDDEFLESIGLKETDEERLEKVKLKNNEKKNIQLKVEHNKKIKNKRNNNINNDDDNYENDYIDDYVDNNFNKNDYY